MTIKPARFIVRDHREFLTSVALNIAIDPGENISPAEAQIPRFSIVDTMQVIRQIHVRPLNSSDMSQLQAICQGEQGKWFSVVDTLDALATLVSEHFLSQQILNFFVQGEHCSPLLVGKKIIFIREPGQFVVEDV